MPTRSQFALEARNSAADLAASRPPVAHVSNGEETEYRLPEVFVWAGHPSHSANFTKGLPHCYETGLALSPLDYSLFVRGIETGNPQDFKETPLGPGVVGSAKLKNANDRDAPLDGCDESVVGKPEEKAPRCPSEEAIDCGTTDAALGGIWKSTMGKGAGKPAKVRAWESAGAGHVSDLEGPDAQAVTMPPPPRLDSQELKVEIAEVYLQALLRDTHFSNFRDVQDGPVTQMADQFACSDGVVTAADADSILGKLGSQRIGEGKLFRGFAKGDDVGPYISQFLLIGNRGINDAPDGTDRCLKDGEISYGSLKISQEVKVAKNCVDYLNTWESWYDAQNGADFRGKEEYLKDGNGKALYRFITTPRDLATYVHYDALYEAYLNACLILLGMKAPLDPGIPYQRDDVYDKQQGFAHFGGPQILSLVCEVATRALKAVRFQKFNVHRRLRPEALAGRIHACKSGKLDLREFGDLVSSLEAENVGLLGLVATHNANRIPKGPHSGDGTAGAGSYLLPMAFPEGSPMHPSYGAGHATVAGACVTVLKAFFDHGHELGNTAYEANADGSGLVALSLDKSLTVEGELNKLAANISIGRDWAGVHYYSDYKESLLMGEKIALGILEEQKLCYPETFHMSVPLFEGGTVRL